MRREIEPEEYDKKSKLPANENVERMRERSMRLNVTNQFNYENLKRILKKNGHLLDQCGRAAVSDRDQFRE